MKVTEVVEDTSVFLLWYQRILQLHKVSHMHYNITIVFTIVFTVLLGVCHVCSEVCTRTNAL